MQRKQHTIKLCFLVALSKLFKTNRAVCINATINEPNAILPNEVVVARCKERVTVLVGVVVNHQLPTAPLVVQCAMFCAVLQAQYKQNIQKVVAKNVPDFEEV